MIVGSFETSFNPLWVLIFWLGLWLGELDSLVKVFRLLRLEQIVLGVQSVDTVGKCITSYPLAGPARVCDAFCLKEFAKVFINEIQDEEKE